jgi:hypothetical protein
MGKGTPSAPPQTDPANLARMQSTANREAAMTQQIMSQTGQHTPYGNVDYEYIGDFDIGNGNKVPRWQAKTTLSPEQQRLYDSQARISQGALDLGQDYIGRIRSATDTPFNYDENFR